VNALDRALLFRLEQGVPLTEEPFAAVAEELGIPEDEVLKRLRALSDNGIIRRFAARINHRNAGIIVNAMVGWRASAEQVERSAAIMARCPEVTHCYERAVVPGRWEYNLFTVLHGRHPAEVDRCIARLAGATGLDDYIVLVSTRELKRAPAGRLAPRTEGRA
jgi:DNA-binding Lrp family transcriptional regulator